MKDIVLETREGIRRKEGIRKKIRRRGGRGTNTGDLKSFGGQIIYFSGRETGSGKRLRRRSDRNLRLMR